MKFESVTIAGQSFTPQLPEWRSLFSDEWSGAPRQVSPEFCASHMKDCGAKMGLPDQWNVYNDPWIGLNKARSLWLFDLQCYSWRKRHYYELSSSDLRYAKGEWKVLFDDGRCFTNHAGTDTCHDYINVTNTTEGDMEYQVLMLAGNKVDVLGNTVSLVESYFGVRKAYPHRRIRALNITNLPPVEKVINDPYVCHLCTTIQPNGTKGVFPQFDGNARGVLWSTTGDLYVWERIIGQHL